MTSMKLVKPLNGHFYYHEHNPRRRQDPAKLHRKPDTLCTHFIILSVTTNHATPPSLFTLTLSLFDVAERTAATTDDSPDLCRYPVQLLAIFCCPRFLLQTIKPKQISSAKKNCNPVPKRPNATTAEQCEATGG